MYAVVLVVLVISIGTGLDDLSQSTVLSSLVPAVMILKAAMKRPPECPQSCRLCAWYKGVNCMQVSAYIFLWLLPFEFVSLSTGCHDADPKVICADASLCALAHTHTHTRTYTHACTHPLMHTLICMLPFCRQFWCSIWDSLSVLVNQVKSILNLLSTCHTKKTSDHTMKVLLAFTRFDLLVNGGGSVKLELIRDPFRSVTASALVPWNQIITMDTVYMALDQTTPPITPNDCVAEHAHYDLLPVVLSTWQHTQLAACPDHSTILPESQVTACLPVFTPCTWFSGMWTVWI